MSPITASLLAAGRWCESTISEPKTDKVGTQGLNQGTGSPPLNGAFHMPERFGVLGFIE